MAAKAYLVKPCIGMTLAFRKTASASLADIPARITHIWPRFRSGDYLVSLEYAKPVKYKNHFISHIDAFMSELYQLPVQPTSTLPQAASATPRIAAQ